MTRKTAAPRNQDLIPGVPRYSRSAMFGKRGKFAKKPTEWKSPAKKQETTPAAVVKDFNGGKRTVAEKAPRWYAAEDAPSRRAVRKAAPRQTKLRESITPGTVLIVLAGRFAGKRVVFLKQLASGLLLVSGPFKVNGVPIRRVNQSYVIATSTKVDISGVSVPEKINDAYFKRPAQAKKTGEFFAQEEKAKNVISDERQADQKALDASILAAVNKVDGLKQYLSARFTLSAGQFPHAMTF